MPTKLTLRQIGPYLAKYRALRESGERVEHQWAISMQERDGVARTFSLFHLTRSGGACIAGSYGIDTELAFHVEPLQRFISARS